MFDANGLPLYEFQTNNVVTGVSYVDNGGLLVSSDECHLYRWVLTEGNVSPPR